MVATAPNSAPENGFRLALRGVKVGVLPPCNRGPTCRVSGGAVTASLPRATLPSLGSPAVGQLSLALLGGVSGREATPSPSCWRFLPCPPAPPGAGTSLPKPFGSWVSSAWSECVEGPLTPGHTSSQETPQVPRLQRPQWALPRALCCPWS